MVLKLPFECPLSYGWAGSSAAPRVEVSLNRADSSLACKVDTARGECGGPDP